MSLDELLRLLQYTKPMDIFERQQLIHEYCYANNIDLNCLYEKPLRIYMLG